MIELIEHYYSKHFSGSLYEHYELREVKINPSMIETVKPISLSVGKYKYKTVRGLLGNKEVSEFAFDREDIVFLVTMHSGKEYYFKEDPTEIKQPKEKADN